MDLPIEVVRKLRKEDLQDFLDGGWPDEFTMPNGVKVSGRWDEHDRKTLWLPDGKWLTVQPDGRVTYHHGHGRTIEYWPTASDVESIYDE